MVRVLKYKYFFTKALGLSLSWVLHHERGVVPSALELEETGGLDKRAIGNWETNVYGKCYDTKLPLIAMRAISGHDSRKGYFKHAHISFYGDATQVHLPNMLFPWLDKPMDKVRNTDNHKLFGFLALLKDYKG